MKKTYLDALMSIFTPIPLNNGFYFVDNNGTIDWILSNIFLLVRGEKRNVSICGRPENDWLLWLSKRYDEVGESDLEKRNVYIALHWAYILASFERRSNEMLYIEGGIGEISGLFIGYSPWTFPDRSHIQR